MSVSGDLHTQAVDDFFIESLIMRRFNHPNVLRLIGVSVHNDIPCAILPLMINGDLKSYVKNNYAVKRNSFRYFTFVTLFFTL